MCVCVVDGLCHCHIRLRIETTGKVFHHDHE
jgi:hypothetical protein